MNYNFFVFKFLLFIILNFLFIFQGFFSLNFFFSSKLDEELIICFAIFFVFILFINHIVTGLQDMLKSRMEIYVNIFLLVFKLIRKALKRFKKHNMKTINIRSVFFLNVISIFLHNLASFFNHQLTFNNYMIQIRFKIITDILLADNELKSMLLKRNVLQAYTLELNYLSLSSLLFF